MKQAVGSMTGDIQNVMFSSTDILRYLNWGSQELARDLKISSSTLSGSPGILQQYDTNVGSISLPAGFIVENVVYMGISSALTRVPRISEFDFWDNVIVPAVTQPTAYMVSDYALNVPAPQSRQILPYPIMPPLGNIWYKIDLQLRPPTLVNDSDTLVTPTICDEALILFVVSRCKLQENDFQAAQAFKSEYNERKRLLIADFSDHSDLEFHNIPDRSNADGSYMWEW
jgi:hypothetical protein